MRPKVSLLVPVFNRAELLVPCLDSALAQTMADLEVVVVDGASTDGTWAVCQRFAAADSRVRVFRDAVNTGPARGWWRCIEEAQGTYATFLWSDDVLMPTFLERTTPLLADPDIGFAFTAAEIGPEPGSGTIHYAHSPGPMPGAQFIEGSLPPRDYPVSPACALFRLDDLRRNFLMELPTAPPIDLTPTGAGIDQLFFLLTALRYPRIACLSEPLAFFRAHPGSLTIDDRGGQVALGYALTERWFARTNGYGDVGRTVLARHWLREMRTSKHVVSPAAAARQFGHLVTARELISSAMSQVLITTPRAFAGRIRRRWRTRRSSPTA
jgi:glycosyltransferase involved in cell wall biosynthesis